MRQTKLLVPMPFNCLFITILYLGIVLIVNLAKIQINTIRMWWDFFINLQCNSLFGNKDGNDDGDDDGGGNKDGDDGDDYGNDEVNDWGDDDDVMVLVIKMGVIVVMTELMIVMMMMIW